MKGDRPPRSVSCQIAASPDRPIEWCCQAVAADVLKHRSHANAVGAGSPGQCRCEAPASLTLANRNPAGNRLITPRNDRDALGEQCPIQRLWKHEYQRLTAVRDRWQRPPLLDRYGFAHGFCDAEALTDGVSQVMASQVHHPRADYQRVDLATLSGGPNSRLGPTPRLSLPGSSNIVRHCMFLSQSSTGAR